MQFYELKSWRQQAVEYKMTPLLQRDQIRDKNNTFIAR